MTLKNDSPFKAVTGLGQFQKEFSGGSGGSCFFVGLGLLLLMQDFFSDKAQVRLLEIECSFSDDYLIGHARRVGLASEQTPPETMARLLPTIRYDVTFESDRIRDAGFENHYRMKQTASVEENTGPLAEFLGIGTEQAREIAATHYLFVD